MATVSHKDIAQSIYSLTEGKSGAELERTLKDVVRFLDRKRLLGKQNAILESLNTLINKTEGIIEVNVTSSHPLTDHIKTELKHALKERYGANEVRMTEHEDKELLGGMRIEVGEEVLDLSLKNKVAQLQAHLIKA